MSFRELPQSGVIRSLTDRSTRQPIIRERMIDTPIRPPSAAVRRVRRPRPMCSRSTGRGSRRVPGRGGGRAGRRRWRRRRSTPTGKARHRSLGTVLCHPGPLPILSSRLQNRRHQSPARGKARRQPPRQSASQSMMLPSSDTSLEGGSIVPTLQTWREGKSVTSARMVRPATFRTSSPPDSAAPPPQCSTMSVQVPVSGFAR